MKNKKHLLLKLKRLFLIYCENTSLHGFGYVNREKNLILKFFWFIICCCCICFGLYLIYIQVERFNTNPTSTLLYSTIYPIWYKPFPSVTICNYNIVYKPATKAIQQILLSEEFSPEDIDGFFLTLARLTLCRDCKSSNISLHKISIYDKMQISLTNKGYNVVNLMKYLAHPCDKLFTKCVWVSKEYPCNILFQTVQASMGFCCVFNYYGTKKIQKELKRKKALAYASGTKEKFGLTVHVNIEEEQYVSSYSPLKAIEVLIHENYAYPDLTLLSYTILNREFVSLAMHSKIIDSDPEVRVLKDYRRGCLLDDEQPMNSTLIYNFQTCINECKARYMLEICNCVPYFVPTLIGQPICAIKDLPCLEKNAGMFANLALRIRLDEKKNQNFVERLSDEVLGCYCLPNCNEARYEGYTIKSVVDQKLGNMTILNVYYYTVSMTKRNRILKNTWDMLLASVGGIFGLCIGGSVFNLLEIVYYAFGSFKEERKNPVGPIANLKKIKVNVAFETNNINIVYDPTKFYN